MELRGDDIISESIDLLKICRMCLKKEKILKSMFHCSVNDVLYADIYQFCTGFKISSSQTVCTSSICTNCETDLLFIYEFKQKIRDNEEKLEKLIHIKSQNAEIENQFLGIDDNFLDYRIELLENDVEKSYNECKFKAINDLSLVQCTKCMNDCNTEKVINAINLNESFIIICEECDTAFSNKANFLQHYTQVHDGTDKTICNDKNHKFAHSCSNSLKDFYNVDQLERHVDISSKNSNKIIWKCLMCNIRFMREDSLKKHFETAHIEENCEFIQETYYSDNSVYKEEEEPKTSKSINKSQMTSCKICGAQFRHRSTKLSHMTREHNVKKPLECHYGCGFTTLKKDRFQAHIDKHENPEKTFNCPICNQAFKSYNSMTLHRAKHTSSLTTFVCSFCNKTFLDRRNYKIHLRLHTKEKLFHCEKCQRGFNRKDHLKNHLNKKGQCDVYAATSNLSCNV
ncbi:zinc finger protein 660-like [Chironomus tepperi]|uniref:zinc finger protein 660-like n=1 Tax=Chironomus tepperi TaxID=113505 RepID=UPI00391F956C